MSGEGQGMTDKAPDAFRTISEVADDLDLPQHVLRFWETRFPQIKPLKRGGGRRYYRPDDVLLLRGIRHLLYGEGYTIKGVQRILKESGVRAVQAVWQEEAAEGETLRPSAAPAQDRFDEDDRFESEQFQDEQPYDERFEKDEADSTFAEAAEDEHEMARDAAPPVPLAGETIDADAAGVAHEPAPVAGMAAPRPEPHPASAPAAPERYVRNANVSIVRGGLPKQNRSGTPAVLERRAEPAAPRFSAEDIQTLKGVLFELIETRKALDLAVNRH
jgi:DNA-binding transcriptional MerR regulator